MEIKIMKAKSKSPLYLQLLVENKSSNTALKNSWHRILRVPQLHGSGDDSSEPTKTHSLKENSEFISYIGNSWLIKILFPMYYLVMLFKVRIFYFIKRLLLYLLNFMLVRVNGNLIKDALVIPIIHH